MECIHTYKHILSYTITSGPLPNSKPALGTFISSSFRELETERQVKKQRGGETGFYTDKKFFCHRLKLGK